MSETITDIEEETTGFDQLIILLESIDQHPEEAVRNHVRALVYTLLDIHHGAFKRIVEIISAQPEGERILEEMDGDELVQAVLMVHDLMAQPIETRVEKALEIARVQLNMYGADVELVEVKNGVARLKLIGSASTANVSSAMLKGEIEQALHQNTPDLLNVKYEDLIAPPKPPVKLVQIKSLKTVPTNSEFENLMPIIRDDEIPTDDLRVVKLADINLLLCNISGTIYAFQNACPKNGESLEKSFLEGPILHCPCHGFQFDVRQNGRCMDNAELHLETLPVKVENGVVKVALPLEG